MKPFSKPNSKFKLDEEAYNEDLINDTGSMITQSLSYPQYLVNKDKEDVQSLTQWSQEKGYIVKPQYEENTLKDAEEYVRIELKKIEEKSRTPASDLLRDP